MSARTALATPVLVLIGPTAIGKTALSLQIATHFGCEIISMDSMQVYRFMDIGTAKASEEERALVPHHLIDIVDPDDQYDAARFVADALRAIVEISGRGRIPLITGGTGLYLAALTKGLFADIPISAAIRDRLRSRLEREGRELLHQELSTVDPESAARVHINDTQRLLRGLEIYTATGIPWSEHLRRQQTSATPRPLTNLMQVGLNCDRSVLYDRIKERTLGMMSDSFQQEVEGLLARGYAATLPAMQSIGYRHMLGCILGQYDRDTATNELIRDTRRYAKRQMTWFGRSPDIRWYDRRQGSQVLTDVENFLK